MEGLLADLEAYLISKGHSKEIIKKTEKGLQISYNMGLISLTRTPVCEKESYTAILYFKPSNLKDYGEDLRKHVTAHAVALKALANPELFTATISSEKDFGRIDLMFDTIEKYIKLYNEAYFAPANSNI
ncbi:MAG: hypothetical protein QW063_03055 [Candidatus Nanoarchaeia archaeon]